MSESDLYPVQLVEMIDEVRREVATRKQVRDGLRIVEGLDGLVIMPAAGLSLDRCPCCDKPFPNTDRGLHGARLVADMLFPLRRNVTDADR